jgi:DNA transposition AAA+ family ATPase
MPAAAGVHLFMKEMAKACYISPESCLEKLRDRVMKAVDSRTLIIVDEMHQAWTSYQRGSAVKVCELLREIYDRTHCGLVICGTNVLRDELHTGTKASVLEQLRRRGTIKVQLPARPPKSDLDKIAKRFGLPPAEGEAAEVVKDMIHQSGLGMYVKFLQSAHLMASRAQKPISWDHYIQAADIIAKLSRKED